MPNNKRKGKSAKLSRQRKRNRAVQEERKPSRLSFRDIDSREPIPKISPTLYCSVFQVGDLELMSNSQTKEVKMEALIIKVMKPSQRKEKFYLKVKTTVGKYVYYELTLRPKMKEPKGDCTGYRWTKNFDIPL